MLEKTFPLVIHIKPEIMDAFKQEVLEKYHALFIDGKKDVLENINLMKDICKEEADFLIYRLKLRYHPIQFNEEMEVQYSVSYMCEYDTVQLRIYLNEEPVLNYVFIKGKTTEMKYFTTETVNQIMAIVDYAFECAEEQKKRADLEDSLNHSLEQVKPSELRSKIKSLVEKLR